MRLNAPTFAIWIVAVFLGVLGILIHEHIVSVPIVSRYVSSFWLTGTGFILLTLSTLLKGV